MVVQDCEHEGSHLGFGEKFAGRKERNSISIKDPFAVLIDLILLHA